MAEDQQHALHREDGVTRREAEELSGIDREGAAAGVDEAAEEMRWLPDSSGPRWTAVSHSVSGAQSEQAVQRRSAPPKRSAA